ncbi:hypothetical protein MMC25_007803 [Agyrium rufum]|nr:hypothetical protein [Agyrium rufum]
MGNPSGNVGDLNKALKYIPILHDPLDSDTSALQLVLELFPEWGKSEGEVKFTRFTDGITNAVGYLLCGYTIALLVVRSSLISVLSPKLFKAVKHRLGHSQAQLDEEAVLIRAYGNKTEVLIDREKETISHLLLAQHDLAPPLLARFQNGLMYRFIPGRVCTSLDLTTEPIFKAVAQRLGQWHAVLPVVSNDMISHMNGDLHLHSTPKPDSLTPHKPTPNIWTIIQKWIVALPLTTQAEIDRRATLQKELERTVRELSNVPGLGKDGLTFSHCDLLSGNVIINPDLPPPSPSRSTDTELESPVSVSVSFIDYEYATPAPPAFDIANHFAEWGGFECIYSQLPTRSQRRTFITSYLRSYDRHLRYGHPNGYPNGDPQPTRQSYSPNSTPSNSLSSASSPSSTPFSTSNYDTFKPDASSDPSAKLTDLTEKELSSEVDRLMAEIDHFRGIPGFYWGIWALIQAQISTIEFDYGRYAEIRLGEYWDWRAAEEAERLGMNAEKGEREARWASE